jgi:hypothetical protein
VFGAASVVLAAPGARANEDTGSGVGVGSGAGGGFGSGVGVVSGVAVDSVAGVDDEVGVGRARVLALAGVPAA